MWARSPPPPPPPPSGTLIDVSFASQLLWALLFAVIQAVIIELSKPAAVRWVSRQKWWPAAMLIQKKQGENFFPEGANAILPEGLTPYHLAESYWLGWVAAGSHAVCALPMLPVVLLGWEESGAEGRTAFVLGALGDVGIDIYDALKLTWSAWLPHHYVRVTGNTPCPIAIWVGACLLHHPLALSLVMPMNAYYPWLPSYHRIEFALLAGGSVCICLAQCKMALNVKTRAGFALFKLIVAIAFVIIAYTRVVVWFVEIRAALAAFALADDANFYRGGVLCASLMSIFNLTVVNDALAALLKFVPKPLPATQEALQEVQEEQATPPAVGRTLSAGPPAVGRTLSAIPPAVGRTLSAGINASYASARSPPHASGEPR